MKGIIHLSITVLLLMFTTGLPGQSSQRPQKHVFYITTGNGDTIQIVGQSLSAYSDTALLIISYLKNKKLRRLQQVRVPFSYPLTISPASFDNKKGFVITYDPAVRYGNSFLFLLDKSKNIFRQVEHFRELGAIYPVFDKTRMSFYSYASCGCADGCWVSKLFTIKDYKLKIIAKLSCDCYKLIATPNTANSSKSCDTFNNGQKFKNIELYWRTLETKGL